MTIQIPMVVIHLLYALGITAILILAMIGAITLYVFRGPQ